MISVSSLLGLDVEKEAFVAPELQDLEPGSQYPFSQYDIVRRDTPKPHRQRVLAPPHLIAQQPSEAGGVAIPREPPRASPPVRLVSSLRAQPLHVVEHSESFGGLRRQRTRPRSLPRWQPLRADGVWLRVDRRRLPLMAVTERQDE